MTRSYATVEKSIAALVAGEDDAVAKMATIACELFHGMDGFDWVGFYRVTGPEMLKIGPYQGGHGCLTIPFSRGVCGKAARDRETVIVADVHAFADHIACSSTTLSEIVVPVQDRDGALIAVLDIDSDRRAHFDADDARALEHILAQAFGPGSVPPPTRAEGQAAD